MSGAPLAGRRVLVTRAADDAAEWAAKLSERGAHPVLFPCIVIAPLAGIETGARLRAALAEADWLVLSSRRGVQAVADLYDSPLPSAVRVATVGAATARAAVETWGRADLVASTPTSEGLATELAAIVTGPRSDAPLHALVAGAIDGRRDAERVLSARGWKVTTIPVYQTLPTPASNERIDLRARGLDDILLASPSAVTGLLNQAVLPSSARIITIGPTTTAAARAAGLVVAAEARRPGLDGMLEAMQ